MILLENILKKSLQDFLKTSWSDVFKTSWISLEDVLKMSWKRLEDVLKMSWRRFWKTSWRRVEDSLTKTIIWSSSRLIEDVMKTSSEDEDERRLQDVFIKTNVCWETLLFKSIGKIISGSMPMLEMPHWQYILLYKAS